MTRVFETILEMSFGAGLLALLIIAARSVIGKKQAMLMPVLCALLILKLIIPISVQSPLSIQNIFASHTPQTTIEITETNTIPSDPEIGDTNTVTVIEETGIADNQPNRPADVSVPQPAKTAWQPSAMDIAALIWILGMAVLTACVTMGNIRFVRMLRRNRPYTAPGFDALLGECKRACRIKTRITVVRVSEINTAAVYGIFRPKLLISPGVFDKLSMQEKRHVLMHELSHIKSRDTLVCMILTAVNIVHWFNPLVWAAFTLMRRDLEVLCDANVLKKIGDSEKHSYASTLLGLLKIPNARPLPLVTALFMRKNSIKRRLKMIFRYKKRTPLYTAIALVLTIIIAVTGCTTAVQDTEPVAQPDTANVQPDGQTGSTEIESHTVADIGELISTYSFDFSNYADDEARVHNIKKAVDLLDNTVIKPDRTASIMGILWPVTAENGWKSAPLMSWEDITKSALASDWQSVVGIIDSTTTQQLGGGIDLVVIAICRAANTAKIDGSGIGYYPTENNGDEINYYSDEAESFDTGNYTFSNIYTSDIVIKTRTEDSNIIVDFYSPSKLEIAPDFASKSEANLMTSFELDYNIHKSSSTFFNVEKAVSLLDGTVIAPGQELSLNSILGPRTEGNGWKAAAGISGGAFVMQYGGGVSAVSNALYNAAIRAELNIVDYSHHSLPSAYVPGGLDATISTGGPDLKIANPYAIDVTIQSSFEDGIVTIDVYGPPLGYTVDFTSKRTGTGETPETIYYYNTESAPDGTPIASGQSYNYIKARQSLAFDVYKTLYDADGNIIETTLFETCTYRERQGVVYVNGSEPE